MDDPATVGEPPGEDDDEGRVGLTIPEIASVSVLILVALLALGGLATGIVSITGNPAQGQGAQVGAEITGVAIENAAAWGGALLAIALLGVLGVAWWQAGTYAEAAEAAGDEATTRLWRAWQLRRWALVGLLVTAADAVAAFVGELIVTMNGPGHEPPIYWAHDILNGASALGTIVVAGAGIWVGGRVRELVSIGDGVDEAAAR